MIRTKRVQQTLYITITGRIHLPLAYELTEALIGVAESCSEYRLDLGAATDISDGGLAVLALFANCPRRRGPGDAAPQDRAAEPGRGQRGPGRQRGERVRTLATYDLST